jgi:hypothetical protein
VARNKLLGTVLDITVGNAKENGTEIHGEGATTSESHNPNIKTVINFTGSHQNSCSHTPKRVR